ncbi:MAG TPA: glycoside hydrolase domain-containing protein [Nitrospirota bacterium]|nr:glycoside hydrolase domain-containing protein [Nitrospirota bacterium]
MKKALYVAFTLEEKTKDMKRVLVTGQLMHDHEKAAQAATTLFRERNGNLVFDIPYDMHDGTYMILIDAVGDSGNVIARGSLQIQKSALGKYADVTLPQTAVSLKEVASPKDILKIRPTKSDKAAGYMIYSRPSVDYVMSGSKPRDTEIIDALTVNTVRNKFQTINFVLYPLRKLGRVKIRVDGLIGHAGRISRQNIRIGVVEPIQDTLGLSPGYYRYLPSLIRPTDSAFLDGGDCCRFWLTVKIDHSVQPGVYKGHIAIMPQFGETRYLPLQVAVEPIDLEDIPGKDYFMLMTYEFTEMAMPGSVREKEKIYCAAANILKNYKEHGMTTLAIHSPFVFMTHEDGTPILDDIFATLTAARDQGFTRPVIWYMGHLIQTAKPKHPGSITGFQEEIHVARLHQLVQTVSEYAKKNQCPPVIFLPIDEPDDVSQDYYGKRQAETPLLLRTIAKSGAKTMLTVQKYDRFKPVDYICSSNVNTQAVRGAHQQGSIFWAYNNELTTQCENPAYARYIYGYYTWNNNLDGMASWTFQNTQNANGMPLAKNAPGNDIFLAYPDPQAPLPTLRWEAIRDGIDDHKLIYQLEKRIAKLKRTNIDASRYEELVSSIRAKGDMPGCHIDNQSPWDSGDFEKIRKEVISAILDADHQYISRTRALY